MFKSIFAKYISAFMLIIMLCFVILTAITTFTVTNYAESAKTDVVSRAADAAKQYLNIEMSRYTWNADKYSDPLTGYIKSYTDSIGSVLMAVASYSDDITILITDNSGRICLIVSSDMVNCPESIYIPQDTLVDFNSGVDIRAVGNIEGLFTSTQIASAAPLSAADGNQVGGVFACASSDSLKDLREVMVKTIFISSLWVMIAALIAVYFITDRVISPLKKMSYAAKRFASGDFSVRVPVHSHDEVAELATAFNNMAQSLESSDKMRNSFMANISHDLRTPMTTIAGFIDGILDGIIPPEKHEYYLNIIATEVRRLSRLVAQLLDISRLEAGDRKFNMQPFDVCEMTRQILISFEQKIDKKRLDVDFDSDSDNMYATADRDSIYQIMYNICDNAVKFSNEEGKLLIGINYCENNKILLTVYNEGQGIKSEDIPFVFERFYKGDKSRGLDKSGVGLGLYIAKTIIDAHHENIRVDSEYGKYCRFSFTLSRTKENSP